MSIVKNLLIFLLVASPSFAAWASKGTITFPAAVGSSTLTDWTGAFTASNAKLKTVANGGTIQNTVTRVGVTVPADFALTTDSTCATITGYSWGIEQYSATAGTLIGWVKMTLTTSAAIVPTVCVGNAAVTTYQGGAKGAEYDSNTQGAYHLPNGSSLTALNFATGASWADGTAVNTPTAATGLLDGGMTTLNTSSQGQGIAVSLLNGNNTSGLTVRAWMKTTTAQTMHIFSTWGSVGANEKFYLAVISNKLQVAANINSAITVNGTTTITDGAWHMVGLTWVVGGSGTLTAFTDGAAQNTAFTLASQLSFSGGEPYIGRDKDDSSFWFTGTVDECRVDYVGRSSDWMQNEYVNQSSPPAMSALSGGSVTTATFIIN